VWVPVVPLLVRRTVPREVEEEVWFISDLFLGKVRRPKGGECRDELREMSCSWVDFQG